MKKTQHQPEQISFFQKRKGAIAVLFAIILPVQLIFLGFCVDFANMHRVRNEARVIADLCAKSAADTLARTAGDTNMAIATAQAVASANTIGGVPHSLDPSEIIFGRAEEQADGRFEFTAGSVPHNSVRVNASRTAAHPNGSVGLFFGSFYGRSEFSFSQTATSSFQDVEICLVLDRSISMKYNVDSSIARPPNNVIRCELPSPTSRWLALDAAVDSFLAELDATPVIERVGLVTFATTSGNGCNMGLTFEASTLDQPLTENTAEIRAVMDDYNNSIWYGGTNITAGINEAKDHMLASGSAARERIIIVLTDGTHRFPDDPPAEAAAECLAQGIKVHTITFSDSASIADMQLTASRGGGEHQHAVNLDDLRISFRRLAGSLAILTE